MKETTSLSPTGHFLNCPVERNCQAGNRGSACYVILDLDESLTGEASLHLEKGSSSDASIVIDCSPLKE